MTQTQPPPPPAIKPAPVTVLDVALSWRSVIRISVQFFVVNLLLALAVYAPLAAIGEFRAWRREARIQQSRQDALNAAEERMRLLDSR